MKVAGSGQRNRTSATPASAQPSLQLASEEEEESGEGAAAVRKRPAIRKRPAAKKKPCSADPTEDGEQVAHDDDVEGGDEEEDDEEEEEEECHNVLQDSPEDDDRPCGRPDPKKHKKGDWKPNPSKTYQTSEYFCKVAKRDFPNGSDFSGTRMYMHDGLADQELCHKMFYPWTIARIREIWGHKTDLIDVPEKSTAAIPNCVVHKRVLVMAGGFTDVAYLLHGSNSDCSGVWALALVRSGAGIAKTFGSFSDRQTSGNPEVERPVWRKAYEYQHGQT